MDFRIRDFDPVSDKDMGIAFIHGLQLYEHAFQPDRRIDDTVAAEYYAVLMERFAKQGGRIFVAEIDGRAVGWAVFVVEENFIYIVETERAYGYIAELYVDESARGAGIGRALIEACEDEARTRKLTTLKIGVLSANRRAAGVYAAAGFAPYSAELKKTL